MGKNIPLVSETGKGKTTKKPLVGQIVAAVMRVMRDVRAGTALYATQRARARTPATTTRNTIRYSMGFGPVCCRGLATVGVRRAVVIRILRAEPLRGSGGPGSGATRRGHGRSSDWWPSASHQAG